MVNLLLCSATLKGRKITKICTPAVLSLQTFRFSMKFYNWLIKYRLYLGIVMIIGGLLLNLTVSGFWPVFPLYFIGLVLIAGHFFFGPLRLIQVHMEEGNMEEAEKIVNSIKFPNLLYKPI